MKPILVTGATGQLGKLVVEALLTRTEAQNITVVVRQPEKAAEWAKQGVAIVRGDYENYPSLVAAFKDTEKLYFISSNDKANRFDHHKNVVNAAVETGVKHLFYTSAHRKSDSPDSLLTSDAHWQTDALIKATGLRYTILKHSLYAELLPFFMGNQVLETDSIVLPAGDGRSAYATRADLAAAGATVLTTNGHDNKEYNLSSQVAYSFQDIAQIMTRLAGKDIRYVDLPADGYAKQMHKQGQSEKSLAGIIHFCEALIRGEFDFPSTDLESLLGRKPQSVSQFLQIAYGL